MLKMSVSWWIELLAEVPEEEEADLGDVAGCVGHGVAVPWACGVDVGGIEFGVV